MSISGGGRKSKGYKCLPIEHMSSSIKSSREEIAEHQKTHEFNVKSKFIIV